MGGGGCYALSTIATIEIVPPHQYSTQMTYMGIAGMLALIVGPIAGGGIGTVTTSRWIFPFNVPVGIAGLALAIAGIPAGFPSSQRSDRGVETPATDVQPGWICRDGFLFLLLSATLFLRRGFLGNRLAIPLGIYLLMQLSLWSPLFLLWLGLVVFGSAA